MKCLKLLFGIALATSMATASSLGLAQEGSEKALTSYISCLRDPLPTTPGIPNYQLVSANSIGFDRVVVWRQPCLDNPTKSAILIRIQPHLPDMTLLTGSLINAQQNGSNIGPFNLLQTTRDVDGYTGWLDRTTTFILAQTTSLPVLLEENEAFKLLFMTGGAASSLDIPSKASTLPVYGEAVEFYNLSLDHYFMTPDPAEINLIELGAAGPNWVRTGRSFRVWLTAAGGGVPVCRFYGTPGMGPNSHFYSSNPAECASIANDQRWTFEGATFFANYIRQDGTNMCPPDTLYLYRVYNNGYLANNSNHRYTTDFDLAMSMVPHGWVMEGPQMCVPR